MLFLLAACHGSRPPAGGDTAFSPLRVGEVVPAYTLQSLTGDTIRVGPGAPATILNVWATWCTECREEMAALETLQRTLGPRGVRVVAISVDQADEARVRRFVAELHLDFAVGHDRAGVIQERYRIPGVPTTLVVDSSGVLRWSYTGNITSLPRLAETIAGSLAGG
jgi:peroxiredoxin